MNRRFGMVLLAAALVGVPGLASAQTPPPQPPAPPPGRVPLIEVPVGCPIQPLPDVVFVGTVVASDYRTARFRIDQIRAGEMAQFASGDLVDVRYGIDTKYLREGDQYLIGARYDANLQALRSRVQAEQPTFGGDEIIGATESDLECPAVTDSMRTMLVDGRSVDSGMLAPLVTDRQDLLRALLVPVAVVLGAIFALAAVRWILTGFGRGIESLVKSPDKSRRARGTPPVRQPVPASATGPPTRGARPRDDPRSLPPGEAGPPHR